MNQDGSFGIPHGEPQEEEDSVAAPNATETQEDVESTSETTANDLDISHESPIEEPATTAGVEDSEPVDIFASAEEQAAESAQAAAPAPQPTATAPGTSRLANNPFNSRNRFQTQNTQPNSNVPQFFNDAIIANTPVEQPKSSKKGLFIGIGIGAVALIGIMLLIISLVGKGGLVPNGNINQDGINVSSKTDFYRYANTILFGNDSTDKLQGNYEADKNYDISNHIYNSKDFDTEYANKVFALFDAFYDKFKNDNPNISTGSAYNYINDYKNLVDFIRTNPSGEKFDDDYIALQFVKRGESETENEIKSILKAYDDDNNTYKKTFYEQKNTELTSMLEYLKQAKAKGCINGSDISQSCAEKYFYKNNQGEDLREIIRESRADSYEYLNDRYAQIIYDCWEITMALEGESE